jgi:hypothetical protein
VSDHNDERLEAAIALVASAGPLPGSVWRHRKGGVYRIVANAIREADHVPLVVYRCEYPQGEFFDRKLTITWARPLAEFTDGRFTLIHQGPKAP